MKFSASLALVAGLTSVSASPLTIKGTEYPDGTTVTEYPNGLPADLVPRAMGVEAEQGGLVKRDNAGVYLCDDINFSGYCVHIVAPLYKCVPLGGDLNDQVSSVGPDKGPYCFFFS
ncbi:MAG: hypothetical protein OHK93_008359 [Ramalina farinacea]|uniref:Uncharacterized protein n=1 Tax=Ramalina farinacea TaxID=258253 RepID=A0AA43QM98_9LECA|nr:hypothetical protein [Ramalina farinacea]